MNCGMRRHSIMLVFPSIVTKIVLAVYDVGGACFIKKDLGFFM